MKFAQAGHKISPEEWALLMILWSKTPQTPSALSDATFKDRTTVTRLVDGLVRKGIAQRHKSAEDRRRSEISLTEHGIAPQPELLPFAMEIINEATSRVSPEDMKTTLKTLRAFAANLA